MLALDLEGTLISNAVSQIPRPGLFEFLEKVSQIFERLVIYTTVREEKFREIAALLSSEGHVPSWFVEPEYIAWSGETKNLRCAPGIDVHQVLLVGDFRI